MLIDDVEYLALLRWVLENPQDDAIRLIISDWLEECGEDERARFIRESVARPSLQAQVESSSNKWLLAGRKHNPVLAESIERELTACFPNATNGCLAIMRRGFISEVRLTTEQFCGGPCQACNGQGLTGREVEDSRGWVVDVKCVKCLGTGRIEGVARELFERHPITRVVLVDRKPNDQVWGNLIEFGWYVIDTHPDQKTPYDLPTMLREHMTTRDNTSESVWHWYPTEATANDALSTACVAHGRRLAGLPALEATR